MLGVGGVSGRGSRRSDLMTGVTSQRVDVGYGFRNARAATNATPTQSATTTMLVSVSLPVRSV
jgi:hypothetical protein